MTKKDSSTPSSEATWTTSKGITITLHGVPPLMIPRIAGSVKYPSKPTYTITLPGGATETHEYDTESIKTAPPEDVTAWEQYLTDLDAAGKLRVARMFTAILMEGVEVDPSPEALVRWKKRQSMIGIEVSDDEEEAMEQYKETAVIGTNDDMQYIFKRVMELTGVTQEVLDQASATFPD